MALRPGVAHPETDSTKQASDCQKESWQPVRFHSAGWPHGSITDRADAFRRCQLKTDGNGLSTYRVGSCLWPQTHATLSGVAGLAHDRELGWVRNHAARMQRLNSARLTIAIQNHSHCSICCPIQMQNRVFNQNKSQENMLRNIRLAAMAATILIRFIGFGFGTAVCRRKSFRLHHFDRVLRADVVVFKFVTFHLNTRALGPFQG